MSYDELEHIPDFFVLHIFILSTNLYMFIIRSWFPIFTVKSTKTLVLKTNRKFLLHFVQTKVIK